MEPRITVAEVWSDNDLRELTFAVCDGRSQVVTSAYVGHDWPTRVAHDLQVFGQQVHGGLYDLEAGRPGIEYANGAFQARFNFYKPTRLYVSTFQQSDYFELKSTKVATEARLYLRTEPGLLDQFVAALRRVGEDGNSEAVLLCIPLTGF